jgi:hypothetical protein
MTTTFEVWQRLYTALAYVSMTVCLGTSLRAQHGVHGRSIPGFEQLQCTDIVATETTVYRCGYLHANISLPQSIPHLDSNGTGLDFVIVRTNLVGDSVISWARIGGGLHDRSRRIRLLADGTVVVAGTVESTDFPRGMPGNNTVNNGGSDIAIVQLSATLTDLIGTRVFGGNGADICEDLDVVNDQSVVVCGSTTSGNLPTTMQALYRVDPGRPWERTYFGGGAPAGGVDGFAAILTLTGAVPHCRYIGSSGNDAVKGVAVLADGSIAATGFVGTGNFQTMPLPRLGIPSTIGTFQESYGGGINDAFVMRMNADLTTNQPGPTSTPSSFASYVGGSGLDVGVDVSQAQNGDILVCGYSTSDDFLKADAIQGSRAGGMDIIVARVSLDGGRLLRLTYFGGNADDMVHGISPSWNARGFAVYGTTFSSDFPCLAMTNQCQVTGGGDVAVAMFNENSFTVSTIIGSNTRDTLAGLTFGPAGDMIATLLTPIPTTPFPGMWTSPSMCHAVSIALGDVSLPERSTPHIICRTDNAVISWTATDMLPSDRYTVQVCSTTEPWRSIAHNLQRSPFSIPTTALPTGTYGVRILSNRGHLDEVGNAFVIANQRQIGIAVTTDTVCTGQPFTIALDDNRAYADPIVISINDTVTIAETELASVFRTLAPGPAIVTATTIRGCDQTQVWARDTFFVMERPHIVRHPVSVTASIDDVIVLHVESNGVNDSYQWQKNGADIPGARSPELALGSTSAEVEGLYTCTITNQCGSTTSDPAEVRLSSVSVSSDVDHALVFVHGDHLVAGPLSEGMPVIVDGWDMSGRVIISSTEITLPWLLPPMPRGIYVLRTRTPRTVHLFRLMR